MSTPSDAPAALSPDAPAAPAAPAAPKPRPSTPAGRVEAAEQHKTKGNTEFQAGNIEAAKKEYDEALLNLGKSTLSPSTFGIAMSAADEAAAPAIEEAGEELAARGKACRIPTQLNLALCCLRSQPCEAGRALELCESVLDEEPENAKAIYRKGKALIELEIFDEAEWELTRACKLMPKDASVRQDLQNLRKQLRETKAAEKRTYEGVFQKGAGFASEGREAEAAALAAASAVAAKEARRGFKYTPLKKPEENPFASSAQPAEESLKLQESGKLEEAIWALEAALEQSKVADGVTELRCLHWLELGRLYMDINIDALALGCFSEAVESQEGLTRQHALLLSAICLLNEAEDDPDKEVSQALAAWLTLARPSTLPAGEAPEEGHVPTDLDEQLALWRKSECENEQPGPDVAVAHGLLHLVRGRPDEALKDFAAVIRAPDDALWFFGHPRRQATKWNMLGAVLANRTRHTDALMAYERALRLQPYYPRALINQGIAQQAASKHLQAAASAARALAIVPEVCQPPLWSMLEKACENCGDDNLAEAAKENNWSQVSELLSAHMVIVTGNADSSESLKILEQIKL